MTKTRAIDVLKGVFVAVLISLICILIFALTIKFFNVNQSMIQPINQIIKFVSILIGVHIMFKGKEKKSLISACLMGLFYTVSAILLFNLLNASLNEIDFSIVTDSLFGAVAGLISGIINKIIR